MGNLGGFAPATAGDAAAPRTSGNVAAESQFESTEPLGGPSGARQRRLRAGLRPWSWTTYVLTSLIPLQGWTAVLITLTSSATSVVALTSAKARHGMVQLAAISALGACRWVLAVGSVTIAGGHIWYSITSLIQGRPAHRGDGRGPAAAFHQPKKSARARSSARSTSTPCSDCSSPWLYSLIDRIESGGFFEGQCRPGGGDFLFFSYTTLTTTGYGDLVPVGTSAGWSPASR